MISVILNFITQQAVECVFMICFAALGFCYRRLVKSFLEDREKNKALAQGVEALLRDRIIDSYRHYEKSEVCPIYAKENVKRLYAPYHKLGGNDVATELMNKLLEMPTM